MADDNQLILFHLKFYAGQTNLINFMFFTPEMILKSIQMRIQIQFVEAKFMTQSHIYLLFVKRVLLMVYFRKLISPVL